MKKNLKALMFGCFVALLLCELILRIYNPFTNFTKQGKLILPANQQVVFQNKWIAQLDSQIHYSRNALGFRGPMPPDSIHHLNSVICIGGSTTECRFLSDDQTWPALLQQQLKDSVPRLWINNAGIDGHSTFGHL
ncbi:MAG TPA: SGNH/GDSL hydrolase family protein, partial [Lacibacter sp.]|nr:SGNH/GDSL hydrolase family protein [Lacibacter sp.]